MLRQETTQSVKSFLIGTGVGFFSAARHYSPTDHETHLLVTTPEFWGGALLVILDSLENRIGGISTFFYIVGCISGMLAHKMFFQQNHVAQDAIEASGFKL